MKSEKMIKIIVDVLMLIIMLLEFSKLYTGGVLQYQKILSLLNNFIIVTSISFFIYNIEKILLKKKEGIKNGKI